MIPAEAVEAAAKALSIHTMVDDSPENEKFRRAVRLEARRALEAAAPHMMAGAIEEIATELDGADRVTRDRDGYTATISLANAATYLRRHAATLRPTP